MTDASQNAPAAAQKPFRWRFHSSAGVILALVFVGEIVGRLVGDLPRRLAADEGFALKDGLVAAFFICAGAWAFLSRKSVTRFFRNMHTGVALVVLTTIAVVAGVLVPQIEGFEDPNQRVTAENYEDQYRRFAWAEGYFLYHMAHLYGIGMPETPLPRTALDNLDRFGRKYGIEERDNRKKRMTAAFSGQAKSREINDFIYRHEKGLRRFFDVATFLDLNRAYKSHWFLSLLTLLGSAIFMNTFTGKPRSWVSMKRVGFFVTHLGMLTMLIGGGISKASTYRGIMHLDLRSGPQDEFFLNYDPNQIAQLPFHLGLERFARKEWMQLEVDFPGEKFQSRPPTYTLWEGREFDLDYHEQDGKDVPALRLAVRKLYDRARANVELREKQDGSQGSSVGAVAQFNVTFAEDASDHAWSDGSQPHVHGSRMTRQVDCVPTLDQFRTLVDPDWQFRIATVFNDGTAQSLAGTFPSDGMALGRLFARDTASGEVEEESVAIHLGDSVDVAGGYRVEVREAVPNYVVDSRTGKDLRDTRPIAVQTPTNPAVIVHITPPDGGETERRVVRQNIDPVSSNLQRDYMYPRLLLYLDWDEWLAPGPPRYYLHWGPSSEPALVTEDGLVTPVKVGEPLPVSADTEVVPTRFFRQAVLETDTEFFDSEPIESGEIDKDFYSREPRGLVLDVITHPEDPAKRRVETVEMVTGSRLANTYVAPDQSFHLTFFENTDMMPFEWRSVLSVHKEDKDGGLLLVDSGTERDSEIRVNDYFYWKGYRFFQTNARADLPTYSGIGVVYDPGIPIVLLGMYTIIAGTLLAFIVRPIVFARRNRKQATA